MKVRVPKQCIICLEMSFSFPVKGVRDIVMSSQLKGGGSYCFSRPHSFLSVCYLLNQSMDFDHQTCKIFVWNMFMVMSTAILSFILPLGPGWRGLIYMECIEAKKTRKLMTLSTPLQNITRTKHQ